MTCKDGLYVVRNNLGRASIAFVVYLTSCALSVVHMLHIARHSACETYQSRIYIIYDSPV